MKNSPLNEGFMLLSNVPRKSSSKKSNSIDIISANEVSKLNSTSSTTCKTTTTIETSSRTFSPVVNNKAVDRDRRSLREAKDRNNMESLLQEFPNENNDEIENFLKIDDEELIDKLQNTTSTFDGSGDSRFQLNKYSFLFCSTATDELKQQISV